MSEVEAPPRAVPTASPADAAAVRHADGPEPVIRTRRLTKKYGTLTAVDKLDLEVYPGEIFGLLGQNGAGKTTTILMLLGLSEPTSGEASVMGLDPAWEPREVKRRVGYLPDAVGFYGGLSGRENLRYTAQLNGLGRRETETAIDEVLGQRRLDRPGERSGRDLLARHAPAARHRRRAGQVAGPAHPRRADDLDRSARRRRDPGPAPQAGRRTRARDHALEPPADPGPVGVRPDRDLRLRSARRAGHRRGAGRPVRRRHGGHRGRARARRRPPMSSARRRCCARSRWSSRSRRPARAAARGGSTSGRPMPRAASARRSWSPPSITACG